MPKLVRLYIRHTLIGFALSGAFVAALLWFNVANLWTLISGSGAGIAAGFLLVLFNGIVFSGVQFGIAIMRMADHDTGGTGVRQRRDAAPTPVLVPVAVPDTPATRG